MLMLLFLMMILMVEQVHVMMLFLLLMHAMLQKLCYFFNVGVGLIAFVNYLPDGFELKVFCLRIIRNIVYEEEKREDY